MYKLILENEISETRLNYNYCGCCVKSKYLKFRGYYDESEFVDEYDLNDAEKYFLEQLELVKQFREALKNG